MELINSSKVKTKKRDKKVSLSEIYEEIVSNYEKENVLTRSEFYRKFNRYLESLEETEIPKSIDREFFAEMGKKRNLDYFYIIDSELTKMFIETQIIPAIQFLNEKLKQHNDDIIKKIKNKEEKKNKTKRTSPFEFAKTVTTIIEKKDGKVKIIQIAKKHRPEEVEKLKKLIKESKYFFYLFEIDGDTAIGVFEKVLEELEELNTLPLDLQVVKNGVFKIRKLGNYGNTKGFAISELHTIIVQDSEAVIHEIAHLIDSLLMEKEAYQYVKNQIVNYFKSKIDLTDEILSKVDYFLSPNEIIARLAEVYYFYKRKREKQNTKENEKITILTKNFEDLSDSSKNIYFNYDKFTKEDWDILNGFFDNFFNEKINLQTIRDRLERNKSLLENRNFEMEYKTIPKKRKSFLERLAKGTFTKRDFKNTLEFQALIGNHLFRKVFKEGTLPTVLVKKYGKNKTLFALYKHIENLFTVIAVDSKMKFYEKTKKIKDLYRKTMYTKLLETLLENFKPLIDKDKITFYDLVNCEILQDLMIEIKKEKGVFGFHFGPFIYGKKFINPFDANAQRVIENYIRKKRLNVNKEQLTSALLSYLLIFSPIMNWKTKLEADNKRGLISEEDFINEYLLKNKEGLDLDLFVFR